MVYKMGWSNPKGWSYTTINTVPLSQRRNLLLRPFKTAYSVKYGMADMQGD
jgi:hypothetical protein